MTHQQGKVPILNRLLKEIRCYKKLFVTLSSDQYKSLNLYEIHNYVHPNDFFFPATSPTKVRNLIFRLRKWFKKHHIPIEVICNNDSYFLSANAPVKIIIHHKDPGVDKFKENKIIELIDVAKKTFENRQFCRSDLEKIWKYSPRQCQYFIKKAIDMNLLTVSGKKQRKVFYIISGS